MYIVGLFIMHRADTPGNVNVLPLLFIQKDEGD